MISDAFKVPSSIASFISVHQYYLPWWPLACYHSFPRFSHLKFFFLGTMGSKNLSYLEKNIVLQTNPFHLELLLQAVDKSMPRRFLPHFPLSTLSKFSIGLKLFHLAVSFRTLKSFKKMKFHTSTII